MTVAEFCSQRFLRYHAVSPGKRQGYGYLVKNHIAPYIGHLRISEVSRATFFNLLVEVLPAEEASQVTVRAVRKVLSAMCQMAFDEGYRENNPIRSIRLKQAPTKPVLVASHEQWRRLEETLTYPPAKLYARLNVTTWARRCEMIGFRPCDFDFGQQMLNVTRSTVYLSSVYHPSGRAGWFTKDHPKNGDWRRFAISKQMCVAVQEHIEEYGIGAADLASRIRWKKSSTPLSRPLDASEVRRQNSTTRTRFGQSTLSRAKSIITLCDAGSRGERAHPPI